MRWPTLYRIDNVPEKHFDGSRCSDRTSRSAEPTSSRSSCSTCSAVELSTSHRMRALRGWIRGRRALGCAVRPARRTIRKHFDGIRAFVEHRVTNARAEGINNKIRLLSHRAYGFHSAAPLIATIYLCCGGIWLPELQLL